MKLGITEKITDIDNTESDTPNYAQALRQLKNADALLQKRKKQLRVQAMRAYKGSFIEHGLAQKQLLRKQVKATNEKVQVQFQTLRLKQLQRVEQYKKRGEKKRQQSFKNRSKSRLEALQNKLRAKHDVRLKSLQHQQRIKSAFIQTIQRRKSLCQNIYNQRKLSRAHFDNFQSSRIGEVNREKSKDRDELIELLRIRQKELCQLDDPNYLLSQVNKKEPFTIQNASLRKSQLPYKNSTSSYLKNRKKSISEAKMDSSRHQLMILS